ncbi:MAG: UDP-N-acetylmuramate: L-alanyl-gamma-D-glutamyl-meso-diaminopimelate ligase [Blastocatellia bacterium]|jgi:UDP-N-acetylmuramate: L-alanyl-gamma-D-glutamyl-meso-diaminopimelate ligase|nr:UDP-N-acetylmuramate: L-alanyl-gamma-D-glutamyl-meso-diaminopimelate ligase [Blastocatellia bacterium]
MHYHLIGICGTAMASLAGMLQARGHRVTGSDENVYPPMSTMLEGIGIRLMQGYDAAHLDTAPDCVVVGNAIPRGNPEVETVLDRRLPYRSLPEVLKEEFIRGRRSLVVAGTHGKTTTTSLAAWVIDQGGLNPSFMVGGVVQNFGASFHVTDSDYFIIEGDEYDTAYFDKGPKFMHYSPELAIVNNIEFDHADIYDDLDAVKLAFRRLMNLVPGTGRLIAGWDSPHVREVIASMGSKLFTKVETFGLGEEAKWQARDIDYSEGMTRFRVWRDGSEWASFKMSLIGDFNVRNCLAAIVAADAWGVDRDVIGSALASFQSVRRRCEVRGEVNGITVIDDFAHHPTAVRETLAALRLKYADRRLVAVFEPRSRTSCHATFQDVYVAAFLPADYVIISQVFDAQRAAEMGGVLDISKLIENIGAQNKPAFAISNVDEIVRRLAAELRSGDVVAIMSNGAFGGIHEKLLSALSAGVKAGTD